MGRDQKTIAHININFGNFIFKVWRNKLIIYSPTNIIDMPDHDKTTKYIDVALYLKP